jgi:hypothetical protein
MPNKSKARAEPTEQKVAHEIREEKRRRSLHPSVVSTTVISGLNRN